MAVSQWSNVSRRTHFFWAPIPAYAFLPCALMIFHLRIWTAVLTLLVIGVLAYLSYRGREVPWIMRRLRLRLRHGVVQSRPLWYRRRTQSLQSMDIVPLPNLDYLLEAQVQPQRTAQKKPTMKGKK